MQISLQPVYDTFAQEYFQDAEATARGTYIERQEQRIIEEYLPVSVSDLVLGMTYEATRFQDFCTDRANLSQALATKINSGPQGRNETAIRSLRTSFASSIFRGIVCFRLGKHFGSEDLEDLLWEAGRLCAPGARLIIDVPSAERRRISCCRTITPRSFHTYTREEFEECRGTRWREVAVVGIALLPVDRLPKWLRGAAGRLNDRLCRTPLRKFAQSRAYVLELM